MKNVTYWIVAFCGMVLLTACTGSEATRPCYTSGEDLKGCRKFHQGMFKYGDAPWAKYTIKRDCEFQYEYDENGTQQHKTKLEWVDNCNYNITFLEIADPKAQYLLNTTVNVKITSTTEDSYKYKISSDDYINELTIIKL